MTTNFEFTQNIMKSRVKLKLRLLRRKVEVITIKLVANLVTSINKKV